MTRRVKKCRHGSTYCAECHGGSSPEMPSAPVCDHGVKIGGICYGCGGTSRVRWSPETPTVPTTPSSPADLARRAIQAADAVEEAWKQDDGTVEGSAERLLDARCDARAAGLTESWLSRETVEAVRAFAGVGGVLDVTWAMYAARLVARDLAASKETP